MLEDSMRAIEMDDTYVKAFLSNGEALVMLGLNSNDLGKI